jgi:hypothetical protein
MANMVVFELYIAVCACVRRSNPFPSAVTLLSAERVLRDSYLASVLVHWTSATHHHARQRFIIDIELHCGCAQIDRLFREVDTDGSGKVDILDWLDYVEPQRVGYCACYYCILNDYCDLNDYILIALVFAAVHSTCCEPSLVAIADAALTECHVCRWFVLRFLVHVCPPLLFQSNKFVWFTKLA